MSIGLWVKNLAAKLVRPVRQSRQVPSPSRDAGTYRGAFRDWHPARTYSKGQREEERSLLSSRVEDLYANNGTARSAVNSLAVNIVGAGLTPQSIIPWRELGVDHDEAQDIQNRIEWLWSEWSADAHYRGQYDFSTMQSLACRSLIRYGEFVQIPIVEKSPRNGCRFRLRLQDVSPVRLLTPYDRLLDPFFHDGVEVDIYGVPKAYWIASPDPVMGAIETTFLTSNDFVRYPAAGPMGRRGIFHVFHAEEEEQFRGVSALAPVVSFLRSFTDSIDNELLAEVMASSFPIFIGIQQGTGALPGVVQTGYEMGPDGMPEKVRYQEAKPAQILYGNPGEAPQVLESSRPSQNFLNFCDLILHQIGACVGIPYEVLTKDYSKTTYSSARAALLEAWRVFDCYRRFFVAQYCQPVFAMVVEEAFLGGLLDLPVSVDDFYRQKRLWTNAHWIGPSRGSIDPLKEVQADVAAINAGLKTRSEAIAERGGVFEDVTQRLADENALRETLGVVTQETTPAAGGNGEKNV